MLNLNGENARMSRDRCTGVLGSYMYIPAVAAVHHPRGRSNLSLQIELVNTWRFVLKAKTKGRERGEAEPAGWASQVPARHRRWLPRSRVPWRRRGDSRWLAGLYYSGSQERTSRNGAGSIFSQADKLYQSTNVIQVHVHVHVWQWTQLNRCKSHELLAYWCAKCAGVLIYSALAKSNQCLHYMYQRSRLSRSTSRASSSIADHSRH